MTTNSVGERSGSREQSAADDRPDGTPLDGLEPGTNVLIAGPPLVGTGGLMLETLARYTERREAGIVISTGDDARSVRRNYRRVAPEERPELVGVVECVADEGGDRLEHGDAPVHSVSSPADLTGIGIGASELLREFEAAGAAGVRVGLDSLSTLLLYSAFDRTCRFLHVLSARIARVDGIGLYVVNPGAVDAGQFDRLATLFDGVAELRERDGRCEVRTRGLAGFDPEWRPYSPPTL